MSPRLPLPLIAWFDLNMQLSECRACFTQHSARFSQAKNLSESSYPPEVFPVGLLWDIVFGVDFSLQGPEASPLRDVFFAEHACYLEHRNISP